MSSMKPPPPVSGIGCGLAVAATAALAPIGETPAGAPARVGVAEPSANSTCLSFTPDT